MEEYLNRLSDLVLKELGKRNVSCVCFAELCGISRNEMGKIINRKVTDIKMSTILKICENSGIRIEDIFGIDEKTENDIEVLVSFGGKIHRFAKK